MKPIEIGIIGAGRIGRLHAENLVRMNGVRIAAISDLFPEPAREWAASIGIPKVSGDYRELLQDASIDAVLICSPTGTHVDIITEAAQAGKAIFCEKPVSLELERTYAAIEAAERAGVPLQIGFNRRFDPNFRKVKDFIEEGRIGDVHSVKITSRDPNPPTPDYVKTSGGLFLDMAIHDFDMARYLSGSEITEVYAMGGVLIDPAIGEMGDIDTAMISLKFANGAFGSIDNSRKACYGYDQRVEVFGAGGSLTADNEYPNNVRVSDGTGIHSEKPKYFFLERYSASYVQEIEDFIAAVRGEREVPVQGRDGLQAELAARAARISLLEGRPVKISEVTESLKEASAQ
ncbi:inositol 2-dehydrogenase [Paenibacillus glycinis]|uniref:Inositol 2-dehydrogenase n=1 Tax=Paenibacillus glycinis TaxID=2697035 RepID=A0ABW9XRV0_9BACL|nr:inositol 2-dehydrogenase [Paenibacillus glycinis]NBD25281.1 inositol 2-dehydrogenase [Paenibacillus glycinis]